MSKAEAGPRVIVCFAPARARALGLGLDDLLSMEGVSLVGTEDMAFGDAADFQCQYRTAVISR